MAGKQKRYDDDYLEEEIEGPGGKIQYKNVRTGGVSDSPHVPKAATAGVVRSKGTSYIDPVTHTMTGTSKNTEEKTTTAGGLEGGGVVAAAAKARAQRQAEAIEEEKKKKKQE